MAAAAEARLLRLIADDQTVQYMRLFDDGSQLYRRTPKELMSAVKEGLAQAEVVHAFGAPSALAQRSANCGWDINVAIGREIGQFFNQWQLQALHWVPVDGANNRFTEWTEIQLFHFPPFRNVSAPDPATAAQRPVYGALNMYRSSSGNPQCGPISAVFSRRRLGAMALAAPFDTGNFFGFCGPFGTTPYFGGHRLANCSAWPERLLGVPGLVTHLLEPYLAFYNYSTPASDASSYMQFNLARLLIRLLSDKTYADAGASALSLNFIENTFGYLELNPVTELTFPDAILFHIGAFELLFGTANGDALVAWCAQRGWPLVWASAPWDSFMRCGPAGGTQCHIPHNITAGAAQNAVRILDPRLASRFTNATIPADALHRFELAWTQFNATALNHNVSAATRAWHSFVDQFWPALAVEPVPPGACHNECIGVNVISRDCVCPFL